MKRTASQAGEGPITPAQKLKEKTGEGSASVDSTPAGSEDEKESVAGGSGSSPKSAKGKVSRAFGCNFGC